MNPTSNASQARLNMITQQIRPCHVPDPQVLALLASVRREDFVPARCKAMAFADMQVALPAGQCMLTPQVEARILQDLAITKNAKVLEVGSGSGFMAALLAQQAQRVISLEIVPELADMARTHLHQAGIRNVDVRCTDGAHGLPAEAPFDVIVLSGSVEQVPPALLEQLQIGGCLFAIVGTEPMMRATFIRRRSATDFDTLQPWDSVAPRLQNFPQAARFRF